MSPNPGTAFFPENKTPAAIPTASQMLGTRLWHAAQHINKQKSAGPSSRGHQAARHFVYSFEVYSFKDKLVSFKVYSSRTGL